MTCFPGPGETIETKERRLDLKVGPVGDGTIDVKLRRLNLKRVGVPGDGACQFRALAVAMWGNSERHREIREKVVKHLEDNKETYEGFIVEEVEGPWDNFIEKMRRPKTWGDETTLRAAAEIYRLEVTVISDSLPIIIRGLNSQDDNNLTPIVLAFQAESHYDATSGRSFVSFVKCLIELCFFF